MSRSVSDEHKYVAQHLLTVFGIMNIVIGLAYVAVEGCAIYYGAYYAYIGYCIWAGFSWGIVNGSVALKAARKFDMHWCRVSLAMGVVGLLVNLVVVVLFSIATNNDLNNLASGKCIVVDVLKVMLGIFLVYASLHQIIALDSYSKYAEIERAAGGAPLQVITVQVPAQQSVGQPTAVAQPGATTVQYQFQAYPQPAAPPPYGTVPNF